MQFLIGRPLIAYISKDDLCSEQKNNDILIKTCQDEGFFRFIFLKNYITNHFITEYNGVKYLFIDKNIFRRV